MKSENYRHKDTCVFLCNYHLIWCPKRRRKILGGSIKERLEHLIAETAPEVDCEILALEVMVDHVHPHDCNDSHVAEGGNPLRKENERCRTVTT